MVVVEKTVIELFYSKTCPNCRPQKKLLKESGFDAEKKFTDVAENQKRAQKFGIRAVPTTIIHGKSEDAPLGFAGVTKAERIRKAVRVASGEADASELESDSVFQILKQKITDIFKR